MSTSKRSRSAPSRSRASARRRPASSARRATARSTSSPSVITSLVEFERIYGDRQQLDFARRRRAADAQLHVARRRAPSSRRAASGSTCSASSAPAVDDGRRRLGDARHGRRRGHAARRSRARFPGAAGERRVRDHAASSGPNVLALEPRRRRPRVAAPLGSTPEPRRRAARRARRRAGSADVRSPARRRHGELLPRRRSRDDAPAGTRGRSQPTGAGTARSPRRCTPTLDPDASDEVRVVTATVTVVPADDPDALAAGLGAACRSTRGTRAPARPTRCSTSSAAHAGEPRAGGARVPIVIERRRRPTRRPRRARRAARGRAGERVERRADATRRPPTSTTAVDRRAARRRQRRRPARGRPSTRASERRHRRTRPGLQAFEDIEDISIVAAPGSTLGYRGPAYRAAGATIIQLLIAPRRADALPDRRARLAATASDLAQVRAMRAAARLQVRRALLPVGPRSSTRSRSRRSTCRRAASSPASTPATTSSARSTRRRPTRSSTLAHRLRAAAQQGPAGGAQPRGHQLLPLLRGPRLPALGRAHDQLRPGVEVRQPAPLLRLPRALDRPRHAVGGVRAQRRAAVGQRPAHDRGLPVQRVADRARCSATSRRRRTSSAATARR